MQPSSEPPGPCPPSSRSTWASRGAFSGHRRSRTEPTEPRGRLGAGLRHNGPGGVLVGLVVWEVWEG